MSTHGNGNGKNGSGDHHRITLPVEEPSIEDKTVTVETVSTDDFEEQRDVMHAWGETEPSMESIHRSITDIQRELKMEVVPTLVRVEILTKMLTAGLESTSRHTNQVDGDVAQVMAELKEFRAETQTRMDTLRKDVQFLKDDVAEMKPHVTRIPVIIDMLGEILARLPDPAAKQ